jgi:hypothetical protein
MCVREKERDRDARMKYYVPNPSSLFIAIKPKAEKSFRSTAMSIFYRSQRCTLSQDLSVYCLSAVVSGLRYCQLVTHTLTALLENY